MGPNSWRKTRFLFRLQCFVLCGVAEASHFQSFNGRKRPIRSPFYLSNQRGELTLNLALILFKRNATWRSYWHDGASNPWYNYLITKFKFQSYAAPDTLFEAFVEKNGWTRYQNVKYGWMLAVKKNGRLKKAAKPNGKSQKSMQFLTLFSEKTPWIGAVKT